jgi:hypothetical protein
VVERSKAHLPINANPGSAVVFLNKVRAEEGTANLRTKFLRFISEDADGPIFKHMRYQHIPANIYRPANDL